MAVFNLLRPVLTSLRIPVPQLVCGKQSQAPEALWVFRTTAPPQLRNCSDGSGTHENLLLGKHSHVVDLNAIAREIARRHGWEVIDMEAYAAKFHHHTSYLRDRHHPDKKLLWTALNTVLNLYQATCRLNESAWDLAEE